MNSFTYFDNAATTFPKMPEVINYASNFTRDYGVNAGRGQYDIASAASRMVKETREELLSLLNATAEYAVVFTPSATLALNMIIQGQEYLNGQTVYVSHFDHNAVNRVLYSLKQRYNLNIEYLKMRKQGLSYDLDSIKEQFKNNPPNYVICNHASNVCGIIAPIEAICAESRKYGAVNIIDMSQTAGLLNIDIARLAADFCVFAGHKTLNSLIGVGGFICRKNVKINCLIYGGTGLYSSEYEMPKRLPERCEPGSLNITAIASLNAAIKCIKQFGIINHYKRELENKTELLQLLKAFENIKIVGECSESVGIVSCVFDGYSPDNIGNILNAQKIAVRTGLHCAPGAHKFLGTYPAGTVRFSVNSLNSTDDFRILEQALKKIKGS